MKVEGLNRPEIVKQLRSWLDLSLNQNVPPALLVLSRAFMMTRTVRNMKERRKRKIEEEGNRGTGDESRGAQPP
jgi:hypothetical protein